MTPRHVFPQSGQRLRWLLLAALGLAAVLIGAAVLSGGWPREQPSLPAPVVWNLRFFFPGRPRLMAWYFNTVTGKGEGLWYEWTTERDFKMNHQYTLPFPLNPCMYDEMAWGEDGLWYGATVDACGDAVLVTRYEQGIQYMPRWWVEGTQPESRGTTDWALYQDGQKIQGGTYEWAYQVVGWEVLTSELQGLHVVTWGKQFWTYPDDWCCRHYEEHWWLGERDNKSLILRSRGGYLPDGLWEWDVWHEGWYEIEEDAPAGDGTSDS